MYKTLLFLTAVALSQAEDRLKEPHPDCPDEGHWLLQHEYDCTKFYYCEGGEKFIAARDCAPGTEFSYFLQVCIHPELAGCELPGYSTIAPEEPETDAPITAAPTTAAPTTAAPTTAAPTTAAPTTAAPTTAAPTTAAPTTAAPTAAPTTAAPTEGPTAAPTDAPTEAPTAAPEDDDDICNDKPAENNRCEEECNVLPWAHDECDKYWTCEGETAVLIVCSEGLHFNPSTQTCDFICNAGCVREKIQTTSNSDGLKVFLPWNQIDNNTKDLLKLIAK